MRNRRYHLDILYEDEAIVVLIKPAGLAVQTAKSGQMDLISEWKNKRAGNRKTTYIGLVHRLDQPVAGVMVFAKTKEAAADLSKQIQQHQFQKEYTAVITRDTRDLSGQDPDRWYELCDYLKKDSRTNTSAVVPEGTAGAKMAELSYRIVEHDPEKELSLIRICLKTGRHHQIRVQLAHAGMPLLADTKYGDPLPDGVYCPVMLCSSKIRFRHPQTKDWMEYTFDGIQYLRNRLKQIERPEARVQYDE